MYLIIIVYPPGSITVGSSLPTLRITGVVINPVNPPLTAIYPSPSCMASFNFGKLEVAFRGRRIQMFICPRRPLVSEHGRSPADTEPSALIFEKGKSKSNTRGVRPSLYSERSSYFLRTLLTRWQSGCPIFLRGLRLPKIETCDGRADSTDSP